MFHRTLIALGIVSTFVLGARGQVAGWSDRFGSTGLASTQGYQAWANSQVVHDDGSGPALYVCGTFDAAGSVATRNIARWNGQAWSRFEGPTELMPVSFSTSLDWLASFDSGSGPELYVGGWFTSIGGTSARNVAKWNGAAWEALGPGANNGTQYEVRCLRVLNDGTSEALYVAAWNGDIGGLGPIALAKWDGAQWSAVGTPLGGQVSDCVFFDDGSGSKLYVGGAALSFGVNQTAPVVFWDGANWQRAGTLPVAYNRASRLEVFDAGSGPTLYAAGQFGLTGISGIPASAVLEWNGTTWSAPGGGVQSGAGSGDVTALQVHDDGAGPALYVCGTFDTAGGGPAANVARWNGTVWSSPGSAPILQAEPGLGAAVYALDLAVFDGGQGPELYLGGSFARAGGVTALAIARWNGASWSALGSGQGLAGEVRALRAHGTELAVGGTLFRGGATPLHNLARWDGAQWSGWSSGADSAVLTLEELDTGSGPELYVGGSFNWIGGLASPAIARWDGAQFVAPSAVSLADTAQICALTTFDIGSGPEAFIGGGFATAGPPYAQNIARVTSAALAPLGAIHPNGIVFSLARHDDRSGGGEQLYVGGAFVKVGAQNVFGIARWNGTTWSGVGAGFGSYVLALEVFDDGMGGGPQLYAGGRFETAEGAYAAHVARWNGSNWEPVGAGLIDPSGFQCEVNALAVFDDGSGPALYAAGSFKQSGSTPTANIARWNGATWDQVAGGLDGTAYALEVFDDGAGFGSALYVGGKFASAGEHASVRIARYGRECGATTYCTSGTTSHGCVASIAASGRPSASASSGFTLSVASVEGQRQGHFFYGLSGPHAAPWGASSHFLCVKAPTQRTATQSSGGTAGACDGSMTLDWNAYVAAHPTSLGVPFSAGTSVWTQLYFRDPTGPKTTALSNGLRFDVCP